ncbi:MAG: prepilin peptidase [Candidatus Gracilibacteria bacterium]|nr:prepilin peptidase [Candidatus Gracilibacteria bacterium]
MDIFFYICLFIYGALMGSFGSVIIYRLKSGEGGITNGRSHCPKCNTMLNALDLVPIFSWILNKAKCGHCKEKVSAVYPILEMSTGFLFAFIGYFLIDPNLIFGLDGIEIYKLIFWLSIGFITILYTFYDILFLEIHEGIMLTGIIIILITIALQTIFPGFDIINILPEGLNRIDGISISISAIIISIIIIGMLYTIMLKELHEFIDITLIIASIGLLYLFKYLFDINLGQIAILNGVVGALAIYIFFYLQILVSRGAWMGGGDLRIAIMIGLILGISFSFAGLMLTYFVGSLIGVGFIVINRIKNKGKKFNTQIPFGPFLAIGFFLTVFYSNYISDFISIYFG